MTRRFMAAFAALPILFLVSGFANGAFAQTQASSGDPCSAFQWEMAHVISAFAAGAKPTRAATRAGDGVPTLEIGTAYSLELVPQESVSFALMPQRPTLDDGSRGGMVRFRVPAAGRYLVALSTGHWIDVLRDGESVTSVNFGGSPGCALPRKVVEFELPAAQDLILQLSGGVAPEVSVVIAPVAGR